MATSFTVDTWDDEDEGVVYDHKIRRAFKFIPDIRIGVKEVEELKAIFGTFDKRNLGYIFAVNILDIFKLAGQNPSKATEDKILQKALQNGTGIIFFPEMLEIFEKHWHSNQFYVDELKDSVKTFSKDTSGRNIVYVKDLKAALMSYGDKFDEKEFDLFEKTLNTGLSRKNIAEGKFHVDDFMKVFAKKTETVKSKGKKSTKK